MSLRAGKAFGWMALSRLSSSKLIPMLNLILVSTMAQYQNVAAAFSPAVQPFAETDLLI